MMGPEEIATHLDSKKTPEAAEQKRQKGYRVTVSYDEMSREEREQKGQSLSRIVRDAMIKRK
jgi:hypothetical protein